MIINHNSLPSALDHNVDSAYVCGGVWVDDQDCFVPVAVTGKFHDTETGHTIWEYAELDPTTGEPIKGEDNKSIIRAALLHVPAGRASSEWRIKPDIAPEDYYESHETVAGEGMFFCWESATEDTPAAFRATPLPQPLRTPLDVLPGDIFQVQAAHKMGVYVLATFPGAPFRDEFEQPIKA